METLLLPNIQLPPIPKISFTFKLHDCLCDYNCKTNCKCNCNVCNSKISF